MIGNDLSKLTYPLRTTRGSAVPNRTWKTSPRLLLCSVKDLWRSLPKKGRLPTMGACFTPGGKLAGPVNFSFRVSRKDMLPVSLVVDSGRVELSMCVCSGSAVYRHTPE